MDVSVRNKAAIGFSPLLKLNITKSSTTANPASRALPIKENVCLRAAELVRLGGGGSALTVVGRNAPPGGGIDTTCCREGETPPPLNCSSRNNPTIKIGDSALEILPIWLRGTQTSSPVRAFLASTSDQVSFSRVHSLCSMFRIAAKKANVRPESSAKRGSSWVFTDQCLIESISAKWSITPPSSPGEVT